ncbi:hypothetical protein T484DRAFT_1853692 [Baffinella frigidus]|nr:hypothetical protein T484DRAFT_1853692 [Cryptophyta sp. CCMP2293]
MDLSAITLKNSPLEGLGMFAARDLEPGETVFTIPRECTVYPEMVLEDRMLGKSMKALASKAGTGIETVALATYLAREKLAGTGIETVALATFLAREKLVGSESSRRAYIEVLPWDSMHPLLWTDAEVDLLEDTYAYEEIMQFRDQVSSVNRGSGMF